MYTAWRAAEPLASEQYLAIRYQTTIQKPIGPDQAGAEAMDDGVPCGEISVGGPEGKPLALRDEDKVGVL